MRNNNIEDMLEYGISSTVKEIPDDVNYRAGVYPGYTAPAKWWNWLFGAITRRLNEIYTTVTSMYNEILNAVGGTAVPGNEHQLKQAILDIAHPIGSYYWSSDATEPSELFGGTWESVKGKFIYACDNEIEAGTTGGSKKIAEKNLPEHNHTINLDTADAGQHYHAYGQGKGNFGWSVTEPSTNWSYINMAVETEDSKVNYDRKYPADHYKSYIFPRASASGDVSGGWIRAIAEGDGDGWGHADSIWLSGGAAVQKNYYGSRNGGMKVTSYSGYHKHNINGSTDPIGAGEDYMPSYEAAYCWKRVS